MRASARCFERLAEPVALAAEGEDRVPRRRRSSPSGSIAISSRPLGTLLDPPDRERELQPGGAADRHRVPRIAGPRGEHRGRVGGRGDPDRRAEIAELARLPRGRSPGRAAPAPARGRTAGGARTRRSRRRVPSAATSRSGASCCGERLHLLAIAGDLDDLGAEPQRVLERVEALDPDEVSRRWCGHGGGGVPCSAARRRGARARCRRRSRSCCRAPATSSSTACSAQARISTSSGESCSIRSSALDPLRRGRRRT